MQATSFAVRPAATARIAVACPAQRLLVARPARSSISSRQQLAVSATAATESPAASSTPEPSYSGAADTYAVVEIGGHQLIVEEGRWYTVNRLDAAPGSKIQLGRVLAHKAGGKFNVGQPYVEGCKVEAEVLEELKGPKIIVFKMKAKKHYRRTNGHRQPLSKILVTSISA